MSWRWLHSKVKEKDGYQEYTQVWPLLRGQHVELPFREAVFDNRKMQARKKLFPNPTLGLL